MYRINYWWNLLYSDVGSLQEPPHSEPPAPATTQSEVGVQAEISDSADMRLPSSSAAPASLQPQSSRAAGPAADSTTSNQPSTAQIPPMRERLGEDLFRLVQVRTDLPKGTELDSKAQLWTEAICPVIAAYQLHESEGGFGSHICQSTICPAECFFDPPGHELFTP